MGTPEWVHSVLPPGGKSLMWRRDPELWWQALYRLAVLALILWALAHDTPTSLIGTFQSVTRALAAEATAFATVEPLAVGP
jgi:hypothetical protein